MPQGPKKHKASEKRKPGPYTTILQATRKASRLEVIDAIAISLYMTHSEQTNEQTSS